MKTAEEWNIMKQLHQPIPRDEDLVISVIKQIQLDAYKAGMTEICKSLQKKVDNYDAEYGHTDLETGIREYPKGGDEYLMELTELIEEIANARDNKTEI